MFDDHWQQVDTWLTPNIMESGHHTLIAYWYKLNSPFWQVTLCTVPTPPNQVEDGLAIEF